MIKLSYTQKEMAEALERIGYKIKLEKTTRTERRYHDKLEEIPTTVYNLYYKGNLVEDPMFEHMFGTQRLEYVFAEETRKRILQLF